MPYMPIYICAYVPIYTCCREQASQICCAARLLFDSERMLGLLRCKSTMQPDFIFPKQFLLQSRMEAALFHPKFSRLEEKKKPSLLSRAFSSFPTCIKEHSNPPPEQPAIRGKATRQLCPLVTDSTPAALQERGNISAGCFDQIMRQLGAPSVQRSGKDGGIGDSKKGR